MPDRCSKINISRVFWTQNGGKQ